MMLKSARLLGVMSAVTLSLGIAACGGDPTPADKPTVTEVTFWSWQRGSKEVVKAFNDTHSDVQVKWEEVPGPPEYYNKLSNAVKAGNAPDVATVEYLRIPELVTQGALQDLTEQAGQLVASKFPKQVQDLVTFGGKTWSVPLDAGAVVYYYRADIFAKHKIDVPKTWAEYRAAAEKLKAADKTARLGVALENPDLLAALSWQAGAKWFGVEGDSWKVSLDTPEARKVTDFWQGLADSDLVFKNQAPEAVAKLQAQGNLASIISGSWNAGYIKGANANQAGKWAVAQLPSWDGSPASAMLGGSSFGIPKGSKKAAAAAKFITWMTTTPEGIKARLGSGASSALPASPELVSVAAQTFDASYFTGEPLYSVTGAALPTIATGWVWGPAMGTTTSALLDQIAKVKAGQLKLTDVLAAAQAKTVADMTSRGLSVKS